MYFRRLRAELDRITYQVLKQTRQLKQNRRKPREKVRPPGDSSILFTDCVVQIRNRFCDTQRRFCLLEGLAIAPQLRVFENIQDEHLHVLYTSSDIVYELIGLLIQLASVSAPTVSRNLRYFAKAIAGRATQYRQTAGDPNWSVSEVFGELALFFLGLFAIGDVLV